jgi:membrane protease YdiL (CAAX protease family)
MLLYPNIILNGVIFGLFHWAVMMQMFGTLNLIYLFAIMCSGIILAFIATYTRRLSASMLAHALFNVIVVGTSASMIPV